jgi:hypothetical protein
VACGNLCTDTQTDTSNCGACANACPAVSNGSATCTAGACGATCNGGYTLCSNACVNTQTDGSNCGACGNACGGGTYCSSGACTCDPVNDLSNVGTGDFTIAFDFQTSVGFAEFLSQRASCDDSPPWFEVTGSFYDGRGIILEISSPYLAIVTNSPGYNDGKPHHLAIHRTSGTLTITVDGNVIGTNQSGQNLTVMPPLQIGNGPCVPYSSEQPGGATNVVLKKC